MPEINLILKSEMSPEEPLRVREAIKMMNQTIVSMNV